MWCFYFCGLTTGWCFSLFLCGNLLPGAECLQMECSALWGSLCTSCWLNHSMHPPFQLSLNNLIETWLELHIHFHPNNWGLKCSLYFPVQHYKWSFTFNKVSSEKQRLSQHAFWCRSHDYTVNTPAQTLYRITHVLHSYCAACDQHVTQRHPHLSLLNPDAAKLVMIYKIQCNKWLKRHD